MPKRVAIAECEYCEGIWQIESEVPANLLEGICMECSADGDVEKPLTFRRPEDDDDLGEIPPLPAGSVTVPD